MSSKSFENATREWVQLRKKLYLQIKADVQRLLAGSQLEFQVLEKKYHRELSQPWRSVSKAFLHENLWSSDIVIFGDFHALQQSQRAHLRILREWPLQQKPMVLAVEFFQARHQKFVDQFMKGKLSEAQFLKKIAWEKSWGFPWEHYKPLMEWARKHKVPIFGINWGIRKTKLQSIALRDEFSAVALKKIHQKFPDQKLVVIYGDLHLSKTFLPAALRRQGGFKKHLIRRVFQNFEPLYFQTLQKGIETHVEVVQLKSGDFCVQSVPPWVKWQSYLLFLEKTYDRHIEEWGDVVDHTDHVAKLVQFLGLEFRVKMKQAALAVYTADDTHVFTRLRQVLSVKEWKVVQNWITEQRTFYVPELQLGYLGRVTVNHTATLAGEYLHSYLCERKHLYFAGQRDFERQIWIQAMAYLGSKIINHKRKTDSVEDLRRSLLMGEPKIETRRVLLLALHQKVREVSYLASGKLIALKKETLADVHYVNAARILGAMLGDKIYNSYRERKWPRSRILTLLRAPIEVREFSHFYYKTLKDL